MLIHVPEKRTMSVVEIDGQKVLVHNEPLSRASMAYILAVTREFDSQFTTRTCTFTGETALVPMWYLISHALPQTI